MADIALAYTAADAAVLDSDLTARAIFERQHVEEALSAVNGRLQEANFEDSPVIIPPEIVRVGAYTEAGMVGATANADYFEDPTFIDIDLADTAADTGYPGRLVSVFGLGKAFHTRETASAIVILWSFTCIVASDHVVDATNTYTTGSETTFDVGARAALYVNGRRVTETDYRLKAGSTTVVDAGDPADVYGLFNPTIPDVRNYTGFLVFDGSFVDDMGGSAPADWANPLLQGHHSVAILVGTDKQVMRVRCRHIGVAVVY